MERRTRPLRLLASLVKTGGATLLIFALGAVPATHGLEREADAPAAEQLSAIIREEFASRASE